MIRYRRSDKQLLFINIVMISIFFVVLYGSVVTYADFKKSELTENIRIIPARIEWQSPKAEVIATPRLRSAHNYERSVAVPRLAAIKIKNVPYIYMSFRINEYKIGEVLRLARIPAERFSSGGHITPLEKWEWIPADRFRIVPDKDVWPTDPSIVGINDMLLVAYKRQGKDNPAAAILFDPIGVRIIWQRNLKEIEGYAGPKGAALPGLARVTSSPPNIDGDYFDSTLGNVVITYDCRQDDSSACRTAEGYRNGAYLQAVFLQGKTVRMGPPVRIFSDEVPYTVRPHEAKGKYPLWHKQNLAVSNLGNDTMLLAVSYNVLSDHEVRPVNRDYPSCSSFFEVPSLSLILKRAQSAGFLDLAELMPKEKTWRQDIRADSPWDQGAMWSHSVYIDPYHNNTVFTMYEGWGAEYMQPDRTRNAFYPGSKDRWVWRQQPAAEKSCNTFCKERKFNGGACFSASAIGLGSKWHGTEIPHDQSLVDYISQKDAAIKGALYVCSDLGTRDEDSDYKHATITVPDNIGAETVAGLADKVCGKTALGYIRAELVLPIAKDQGYTLSPERKVNPDETLTVACSTQFSSKAFHLTKISDQETSCDMACDSLGTGSGIGYRPYHAEVIAKGKDGKASVLDRVGVDPDFVLSMLGKLEIPGDKKIADLKETGLTCVCGPGRNLRATMAVRRGRLIQ